jgi:predicted metalloprotease with PDZ domain
VTHQPNFYGSTSLVDRDNSNTRDQYIVPSYNEAIDRSAIMYTVPDTAHIRVGESDILISVYSPGKKATAKGLAVQLDTLLQAQGKYLGGKLPVQNYSFLIYLADHEGLTRRLRRAGALLRLYVLSDRWRGQRAGSYCA